MTYNRLNCRNGTLKRIYLNIMWSTNDILGPRKKTISSLYMQEAGFLMI